MVGSSDVKVSTIDRYCADKKIERIDLLKSDTQGFELEVLKGARHMLVERRVGAIYVEITFAQLYDNLPRLMPSSRVMALILYHSTNFTTSTDLPDGLMRYSVRGAALAGRRGSPQNSSFGWSKVRSHRKIIGILPIAG